MRITGGTHRSRTLRVPRGQETRPTSDRVREALFGALASAGAIEQARVLDLYAGTGALALEALSRGAAHATLVESSRAALATIRENVAALGLSGHTRIIASKVSAVTSELVRDAPFDLVLVDPPYAMVDSGAVPDALAELARAGVFGAFADIVLEHASRSAAPNIQGLARIRTRPYGDTTLTFYKPAILARPRGGDARSNP
jgi:16S rRNA (guanine966-N2)-methyltransferase